MSLSVLVVHSELPLHDRHSGSLRLFRILELLAEEHDVTLVARAGLGQERYTAELTRLGVNVHPVDPVRLRERGHDLPLAPLDLEGVLRRGRFDVAILSFYEVAEQYLPLLRRHSPATKAVIDTVDVHWVRERRGAELAGDAAALAAAERTRRREADIYGAADALIAVSEDDAVALRELAPDVPVAVVSNVHDEEPAGPAFSERGGLLFVGNFGHAPNVDAVVDFHARSWPLVRAALPDVAWSIVGTDPPPAVRALAGDGVEVTGWVPETAPYVAGARVSIAPLRYGAGVKGKIGEALSHGLPVVTTTIGAEGMGIVSGEHALVADDPEALAAEIVRLHSDRELWERLSAGGRALIEATLGRAAAREALRALFAMATRTCFVAGATWRDELDDLLAGYLGAFTPGDAVSLLLPVDGEAALQDAFDAVLAGLGALGRDPEDIPDICILPWSAELPLPAASVPVGAGFDWAGAARPAAARRERVARPRAALLLEATGDAAELRDQLRAVREVVPAGVEVVVAAGADCPAVDAVLEAEGSGARVVRTPAAIGRSAAIAFAAAGARAEHTIALAPLTRPRAGFAEPLLETLAGGATLAGPVVDGAHGLRIAPDGSLWPLSTTALAADALALDCLAAPRALWAGGVPAPDAREGHREAALARWAGGVTVAATSAVDRAPAPPASVIICTRDRSEELPDAVALLVALGATRGEGEVLIVDNASSDDTPEIARELEARHPGVRYVLAPEPGLARARAVAAEVARHDLLLFLDDDARPAPGWLEHVGRTLARDGVANVGGPICALWPSSRPAGWPHPGHEALLSVLDRGDRDHDVVPPDVLYGANWAVDRRALRAVGGFDVSFGFGPDTKIGGEEVSVAWRLMQQGAGASRYVAGGAVGHRIDPGRIDDAFLVRRSFTVGVERARHEVALHGVRQPALVDAASRSASRLMAAVPLEGDVTVEDAFARVLAAPAHVSLQVPAADALGELAACVALLGETEAHVGTLRLRVAEHNLNGVLAAPVRS